MEMTKAETDWTCRFINTPTTAMSLLRIWFVKKDVAIPNGYAGQEMDVDLSRAASEHVM